MPARDNRFTIHLSRDLKFIESKLMKQEQFRTHSECYCSFLRHWADSQQAHVLTGGIASLEPPERKVIDRNLRRLLEAGRTADGKWLLSLIEKAIEELENPAGVRAVPAVVIRSKANPKDFLEKFTVCICDDLFAIEREIMRRERYRSHAECYASFLRHWALIQQPHKATAKLTALPAGERDALDAQLRRQVETGMGKKGSWLKVRIYETIKQKLGPEAKSPTVDQVMIRLPQVVRAELVALNF